MLAFALGGGAARAYALDRTPVQGQGDASAFAGDLQAGFDAALSSSQIGGVPKSSHAELPSVLGAADVGRYRRIFAVQEAGDWKTADRLIAKLDDRVLMGHVLAQRYLHPTKYRSHYKELKRWLARYADLPEADRIYKLALRRKPRNWRAPNRPKGVPALRPVKDVGASRGQAARTYARNLTYTGSRRVRAYKRKIRSLLRSGWTKSTKRLIESKAVRRAFSSADMDWARARLAQGYFSAGRDSWALQWAEKAARRSGDKVPDAHWFAGLAAWRLGKFQIAADHFEQAAKFEDSPWTVAAAAFWAARANLVARRPGRVEDYLREASAQGHTFYGILARRVLGLPLGFDWSVPALSGDVRARLIANPGARRALALLEVGDAARAGRELLLAAARGGDALAKDVMALAVRADMASLAVRLSSALYPSGGGYDGAAYPVPYWRPEGGFQVDRALIYALVRQESRFNPRAKSSAGARGLMQLMPGTASFIAGDGGYRRSKRKHLFSPERNLKLGQSYVEFLLSDSKINGDLFLMAAAWNGGPGNLNKWRRNTDDMDDALFFIESIPSRETRDFIERVHANLWAYRDRLGQPSPSLDALAAGRWPVYTALGQQSVVVAENVKN
ncbi:lytic transglycosylase domain-containing protein [Varunaivibrio sulfuroxidans]|uniref:Soluble lytic murein transglycosylase-like protein n=1 Tax=Varunaivibrio sulfuroxidans TaxID=1773489 RepID=A0A4R3JCR1_9PROT|nr:lytic transglycosylase domain-containing protein [Varunaivibrio sulfuroxidans]TCS63552.1 soluble lytic murein transglycosylase-like protein [Varunaivibrio sulfuroxidans]WES30303.1 lytic transglycosylase domain-containing protein [Varunaivibrio sulfuroxidans]